MKKCTLCALKTADITTLPLPSLQPVFSLKSHTLCSLCTEILTPATALKKPFLSTIDTFIYGNIYKNRLPENTPALLLQHFKYRKNIIFGQLLTLTLIEKITRHIAHNPTPEYFVVMPPHTERLKERGFSQTAMIGLWLSRYFKIPLLPLLKRTGNPKPQAGLSKVDRLLNIRNTFMLNTSQADRLSQYTHVALIDDVLTTGATLCTAADCIRSFEPSVTIDAWTLLYSPEPT